MQMQIEGHVLNTPELKVSVKGVHYLKFTVEVPAQKQGQWLRRVYVTMFGDEAQSAARQMPTPGYKVKISGTPETRAFLDKMNQPKAVQELIGRQWTVLSAPNNQSPQQDWQPPNEQWTTAMNNALKKEPSFGEDDIPF